MKVWGKKDGEGVPGACWGGGVPRGQEGKVVALAVIGGISEGGLKRETWENGRGQGKEKTHN